MSLDFKHTLINKLSKEWKIFISSETPLTEEFLKYKLNVPPDRIHDVLAYTTLFIGEGATMASECAILGTPAIYINTISPGTIEEQEHYGLLYGFRNSEGVHEKVMQMLNSQNIKVENQKKRNKMLSEKIDVTALMVWFIENYPKSAEILKTNPDYQNVFK
jgi:predicted glycosyltransferase